MSDEKRRDQEDVQEEQIEREEIQEVKDEVGEELTSLKQIVSQLENNYKRALADYQNLQRRTQEERGEWIRSANKDLILKLLPVLDTLMLAGKHLQDKGLELSIDQFLRTLEQEGVRRIETIGKEFDPNTMEAVSTKEADSEKGKVVEEMRAGYMFYDTIIRAAQVIVGA